MRRYRQLNALQSTTAKPELVVRTMSDIETVPIIERTLSQAEMAGQTARSKKNWVLARAGVKRLIQASRGPFQLLPQHCTCPKQPPIALPSATSLLVKYFRVLDGL